MIVVGIIRDPDGLEAEQVGAEVVLAAEGIEQWSGGRIAIVVHIQGGISFGGHPHRVTVVGRQGVATRAGGPGHDADGGQCPDGNQRRPPVIGLVSADGLSAIGGGNRDELQSIGGVKISAAVGGHTVDGGAVGRNTHNGCGVKGLAGHIDVGFIRIVEINLGGDRAHGVHAGVIIGVPLTIGKQFVKTHFVVGANVTRDQVGLNRLGGDNAGSLEGETTDITFTFAEKHRVVDVAVGVGVELHYRRIISGGHVDGRVFKHLIRAGIDTDRGAKLESEFTAVIYLRGIGEHFTRTWGEEITTDRDPAGHRHLVAGVVIKIGRIARNGDIVDQTDDVAFVDAIDAKRGRNAVGRVVVAPDLGGRLGGGKDVFLVSIFPVIPKNNRVGDTADDGNGTADGAANGTAKVVDGIQRNIHLFFVEGHKKGLHHGLRPGRDQQGDPKRSRCGKFLSGTTKGET